MADDRESRVARQTALFDYLEKLTTAASTYQRRRELACRDLTDLIGRYVQHRKRKASGDCGEPCGTSGPHSKTRATGGHSKAKVKVAQDLFALSESDEPDDSSD